MEIRKGDIVQITDETHHWYPALIVVDEQRSWGIQGYTVMVDNTDESNGLAYIRLELGRYEWVGRVVIDTKENDEDG